MISRWLPLCARAGAAKATATDARLARTVKERKGFPAFMANPPWKKNPGKSRGARFIEDAPPFGDASVRERIGTNLDPVDLRAVLRAAFVVEHGARARHRPQAFAFPAAVRLA